MIKILSKKFVLSLNFCIPGGETAEMPNMYPPGEYDVAGFAVGAVERDQLMPRIASIQPGDVILALPSSGVHSNGFSLVRKIMKLAGVSYRDKAPFSKTGKTFGWLKKVFNLILICDSQERNC